MSALPTAYSLLRRQPWVHSARIDTVFLLAPGPLATVFALWLLGSGRGRLDVSPWLWLGLVVGIDVAHVYATLYRTYLDRWERQRLSAWLVSAPLGTWVLGVALYSARPGIFWSALAYAAVFHFVRQQYGFLMLYARAEGSLPQWCRRIDHVAIYGATLFPLLYWHTHLPRAFSWLIEGDFFRLPALLWTVLGPLYALLGLAYLAKEAWLTRHLRVFNLPRNALVLGTFASWFVGIVLAQGDLIFTLINVVGVEFLINFGGLGQLIADLAERYDLAGTYAAICFVVLVSVVFFMATERAERWLTSAA